MSNFQSKTKRFLIHCHRKQRQAANLFKHKWQIFSGFNKNRRFAAFLCFPWQLIKNLLISHLCLKNNHKLLLINLLMINYVWLRITMSQGNVKRCVMSPPLKAGVFIISQQSRAFCCSMRLCRCYSIQVKWHTHTFTVCASVCMWSACGRLSVAIVTLGKAYLEGET